MPAKITILCPFHAEEEELTIPDAYLGLGYAQGLEAVFEGDLPCNPSRPEGGHCILHVKIHFQGATDTWVERLTASQSV